MLAKPLVAAFGEFLIRIQPQSDQLINNLAKMYPGGSEANVIYALAQQQIATRYLTALPDHQIAKEMVACLKSKNVDVSKIRYHGDRVGTYTLLHHNGLTKGAVIYDRNYSSFAQIVPNSIDWEQALEGCTWLHWTAITPALSENLAEIMLEILKVAQNKGMTISVDLNYRNKLWNYNKTPLAIMPKLVGYCNVIMGNIWAANTMLATTLTQNIKTASSQDQYLSNAKIMAKEIFENYPNCKHVANLFRFTSTEKHNLIYSTYHTPQDTFMSKTLETDELIDRIGSGDAYMAGLIYSIIKGQNGNETVNTALTFGYKKLFVAGDFLEF